METTRQRLLLEVISKAQVVLTVLALLQFWALAFSIMTTDSREMVSPRYWLILCVRAILVPLTLVAVHKLGRKAYAVRGVIPPASAAVALSADLRSARAELRSALAELAEKVNLLGSDRSARAEALKRVRTIRLVGDCIRDLRDRSGHKTEETVMLLISGMRIEAEHAPIPLVFGRRRTRHAVHEAKLFTDVLADARAPESMAAIAAHALDKSALDLEETIEGGIGLREIAGERARNLVRKAIDSSANR